MDKLLVVKSIVLFKLGNNFKIIIRENVLGLHYMVSVFEQYSNLNLKKILF